MAVFACARCGAVLTAEVSEVALPAQAHDRYGHDLLPPLMPPGTYAVDPEPSGPPWRPWGDVDPDVAAARGVFAPVASLSFGRPGAVVIAPGEVRGTFMIPGRNGGYCLGLTGVDGPNMGCEGCGAALATRVDDCSYWQAVWFDPDAVRRRPSGATVSPVVAWEALAAEWPSTPPIEQGGWWSPVWPAAVGAALAHLLAASRGVSVAVPGGLVAEVFGGTLQSLLPSGPPVRKAVLAGPGLPSESADIALVPLHPQTGEAWQPGGGTAVVPVAADVWLHLAFHREPLPVPATGGLPHGVLRDDPLPLHPALPFQPSRRTLRHTLARLPAVRQPWLRALHDRLGEGP
ncbi:hypothetical protein AB0M28_21800 [Streptomyces sp. NPDC051940]|uniref:hypothetical protein n=1 Tax=Streptomyces sp. NPDC051940 TaxID=3155675 RepID=UPI0034459A8D